MTEKTSSEDVPNRPKQERTIFLILLVVLGVFLVAFVFSLFKNNPEKEVSLSQALTMVAEGSQTAQALNPVSRTTRTARSSPGPTATHVAINTPLARSSFVKPTKITPIQTPRIVQTINKHSASFSTANSNETAQNNNQGAPTFPVSNATVRPTYTPKPTETTRPTYPTATLTSTATPSPGLPGLSMNAVINQLKEKGFTCSQAASAPGPILWMCDIQTGNDLWYHVDLYGSSTIEVNNLLASVFQTYPDDTKAVDILGFIASLPYNDSNASEVRQWVSQTLPAIQSADEVKEKIIGGVRFKLYGGPQGRYMEMGDPVQQ